MLLSSGQSSGRRDELGPWASEGNILSPLGHPEPISFVSPMQSINGSPDITSAPGIGLPAFPQAQCHDALQEAAPALALTVELGLHWQALLRYVCPIPTQDITAGESAQTVRTLCMSTSLCWDPLYLCLGNSALTGSSFYISFSWLLVLRSPSFPPPHPPHLWN